MRTLFILLAAVGLAVVNAQGGNNNNNNNNNRREGDPPGADPNRQDLPTELPPGPTPEPATGDPSDLNDFLFFFPAEAEPPVDSVDYTGYFHNLAFPTWGAIDEEFTRQADFDYADNVYAPREGPNPRTLSRRLFEDRSGLSSTLNRTALMTWFGQQLVEEIMDGQRPGCPPEFSNVEIPTCDPLYDPDCKGGVEMPVRRARYHLETGRGPALPRNQINEITPWLDGNIMYGPGKAWTDALRSLEGGRLRLDDTGLYPPKNDIGLPYANAHVPVDNFFRDARRFHMVGNPRGFENPALASLHILWHREHNLQADRLALLHPDWTDERLFNRARQWVIALYQKIVFDEFVPAFTGTALEVYQGFRSEHPGITHSFQVAAMRFGHTLVPPGMWLRGANSSATGGSVCSFDVDGNFDGHAARDTNVVGTLRTCNTYGNSVAVLDHIGIEPILRGAASQLTELEDHHVTEDLRGFVFGPKEFTRMDLMALNIQRGREHGVPPFNDVREAYNLPRYTLWSNITTNDTLIAALTELYESIDDVDLWVGGLLEGGLNGPGETFQTIQIEQFERLRDGDRWYYKNQRNGLFSVEDIAAIDATKFSDILRRNGVGPVQDDVFFHVDGDVCPQPFQLDGDNPDHLNECSPPEFFDWYSSSDYHIMAVVIIIVVWILMWSVIAFLQVRAVKKKAASAKKQNAAAGAVKSPTAAVYDIGINVTSNLAHANTVRRIAKRSTFRIEKARRADVTAFLQAAMISVRSTTPTDPPVESISIFDFAALLRERVDSRLVQLLLAGVHRRGDDMSCVTFPQMCTIMGVLLTPDTDNKASFFFNLLDANNDGEVRFQEFRELVSSLSTKAHAGSSRRLNNFVDRQSRARRTRVSRAGTESKAMVSPVHGTDGHTGAWSGAFDPDLEREIQQQFEKIDKNHDGRISKDEFRQYIESGGSVLDPLIASVGFGTVWKPKLHPAVVDGKKGSPRSNAVAPHAGAGEPQDDGTSPRKVSNLSAILYENRVWFTFLVFYTCANVFVVTERVYTYAVERELRGLRQIAGYGIATTRGAASGIMFNMVLLLLPTAKRVIALLRTTWFGTVLPLEHASEFHIIAGATTAFFMVVHTIGHLFNFFHVSTQPIFDINCLFREIYLYSNEIPSFAGFWLLQTATGSTGFLLVVVFVPFFIYCIKYVRQVAFRTFKTIHLWGTFLGFALTTIHGGAALVQAPGFLHYCALPFLVLAVEFLLRVQNSFKKLRIVRVEALASGVTMVELRKPAYFNYHAGQYINLTLSPLGLFKQRTFTLTSAPHEDVLRCHIAATAPHTWTGALHEQARDRMSALGSVNSMLAESAAVAPAADSPSQPTKPGQVVLSEEMPDPNAYAQVSGPFGASFTHWADYDAIVLCGGGIGVTPFASILSAVLNQWRTEKAQKARFPRLSRLYFLWTSRTQDQLEWFTELLGTLEAEDEDGVLETHLFLTAKANAFDLRIMAARALKEQLDVRSSASKHTADTRCLFAPIHFGRPDYHQVFCEIQKLHQGSEIGVFTCGPGPMSAAVGAACRSASAADIDTPLRHSTENFY